MDTNGTVEIYGSSNVCLLVAERPSNMLLYLRVRSAQTNVRVATFSSVQFRKHCYLFREISFVVPQHYS